jgi:hypothetical protein
MSPLERLPTELIERIFFFCMNLDLPRSSPVIGGKLSSEVIYLRSVISAFGPTWNDTFGFHKYIDRSPLSRPVGPPGRVKERAAPGDAKLQV